MILSRRDSPKGWIDPGSKAEWVSCSSTRHLPHILTQPSSLFPPELRIPPLATSLKKLTPALSSALHGVNGF